MSYKYYGNVVWRIEGDVNTNHLHHARLMLGKLDTMVKMNGWRTHSLTNENVDGATIIVTISEGIKYARIVVTTTEEEKRALESEGSIIVYYTDNTDTYYQTFFYEQEVWNAGPGGLFEWSATDPEDIVGTLYATGPEAGVYFFGGPHLITAFGNRSPIYQAFGKQGFNGSLVNGNRFDLSTTGGLQPDIYYGGSHLCNAPAPICGGTVVDNFLVCFKWEAIPTSGFPISEVTDLTVYWRPFQTAYSNDDAYDASTNPNGWRTQTVSLAESLWMKQSVQFNSVGNEGVVDCAVSSGNEYEQAESSSSPRYTGYHVHFYLTISENGDLTVTLSTLNTQDKKGTFSGYPTYGTTAQVTYPTAEKITSYTSGYNLANNIVQCTVGFANYHVSGLYQNDFEYSGFIDGALTVSLHNVNTTDMPDSIAYRYRLSQPEDVYYPQSVDPEYSAVGYANFKYITSYVEGSITATLKVGINEINKDLGSFTSGLNTGIVYNLAPDAYPEDVLRNPTLFINNPVANSFLPPIRVWGIPKRFNDILFGSIYVDGDSTETFCTESSPDIGAFISTIDTNNYKILYVSSYEVIQ